jgi:hypothetical protein
MATPEMPSLRIPPLGIGTSHSPTTTAVACWTSWRRNAGAQ